MRLPELGDIDGRMVQSRPGLHTTIYFYLESSNETSCRIERRLLQDFFTYYSSPSPTGYSANTLLYGIYFPCKVDC